MPSADPRELCYFWPLALRFLSQARFWRRNYKNASSSDEAEDSASHTQPVACARGPIRRKRCLQRLLVHVSAKRQEIWQEAAREEQSGASRNREEGSTAGLAGFPWRFVSGPWCQLTPRDALPWLDRVWRLRRVDDVPVWSISCFYIRKGYRKQGVTSALIAAALKIAKSAGAPALEAYPLDADLTNSSSWTGYASTFARAGFRIVGRRTPSRPIMRRDLMGSFNHTS